MLYQVKINIDLLHELFTCECQEFVKLDSF